MSESATNSSVVAAVVCDFERSPVGTRSRLGDELRGEMVVRRTLGRLARVKGIAGIALMVPESQMGRVEGLRSLGLGVEIKILPLAERPGTISRRVEIGRAWDLVAWRGGAGQFTVFDEDYHPAGIAAACAAWGAENVLVVPGHAAMLDAELTSQLVEHHLHKNHEMRLTYTPAAPGLTGVVLQASMVHEMAEKMVLPGQLLGYDPNSPTFDTLIREACMQVDPALSKIQNRFLVDTERSFRQAEFLLGEKFESAAAMALAAREFSQRSREPREVEIELTTERLTRPPGNAGSERAGRAASEWSAWFAAQKFADDLLVTFAGDGDPLLYPELLDVLRAARGAGPRSVHVQTDLASDVGPLLEAIRENLVDVISVNFYGTDAATYAAVGRADLYARVVENITRLADATRTNVHGSGLPLVVPRLLKVRGTIPQMEGFFDTWIRNCGWAVIDYPTDRAGSVPFEAVVDMAPPKRRACRRIGDRLVIRANGRAVACDQDVKDALAFGGIGEKSLGEMWRSESACALRGRHAEGKWNEIVPCMSCREWHRA